MGDEVSISIDLPRNFQAAAFERMLQMRRSELKRADAVVFDLRLVTWCDPYAVGLLVLWLQTLKKAGKKLHVVLPTPKHTAVSGDSSDNQDSKEPSVVAASSDSHELKQLRLLSFLVQLRFVELLDEFKIPHNEFDLSLSERQPKALDSFFSPYLRFAKSTNLNAFLKTLRSTDQFNLFFQGASEYAVVTSGKIRDVILRELGDNIFDHAEGDSGFLVMNKSSGAGIRAPSWEQPFFYRLRGEKFLEIVVSDRGPGIFQTLSETMIAEFGDRMRKKGPSNSEVMEYAFLQYSTRKTPQERLKRLVQVLKSTKQFDAMPATGLYWVKEVCREFRGMLSIRSRTSVLVYDFLTKPHQKVPLILESIKSGNRHSKLRDLPGVQIKLCFPVVSQDHESLRKMVRSRLTTDIGASYDFFSAAPVFEASDPDDLNSQAGPLLEVINSLQALKHHRVEKERVLILDLDDVSLSNKAFFILGVELLRMQEQGWLITAINADSLISLKNEFHEFCAAQRVETKGVIKEKILVAFDSNWSPNLLGLDGETASLVFDAVDLAVNSANKRAPNIFEIAPIRHLVEESDGNYRWLFSLAEIQRVYCQRLRVDLQTILAATDEKYKVYHPDKWFLIPSRSYCFGFFEIRRLLANPEAFKKLSRWIEFRLTDFKPDIIVTVGSPEGISAILPRTDTSYTRIDIQDPEKPSTWVKLTLLEKGARIAVLTDVIGTGKSIQSVLEKLPERQECKILAVVDARQNRELPNDQIRFEGRDYTLESILRFPINFEGDLPDGCTYNDIVIIDPVSHAPIWEDPDKRIAFWDNFDDFLDQIVRRSNSIVSGHFESDSKHILYFFLTPSIVEKFGDAIVERIRGDVLSTYQKLNRPLKINAVFYPAKSPGADTVAESLAVSSEFLGSVPYALSSKMLANPISYSWAQTFELKDVIIFDDAVSSGSTLERMVDLVESWGAKRIFVYVLFNRCSEYQTRLLEKKKGHGTAKVEVRFLTNVRIPAFEIADCPVCKSIRELEAARNLAGGQRNLARFLETKISQLKPQPIRVLFNSSTRAVFLSANIDRRIARCKLRRKLEGAISDPAERNSLANLLRGKDQEAKLLFFSVLAKERYAFDPSDSRLGELFYPTFREEVIKAAKKSFVRPLQISPKELDATIGVLRMFDEDIFLAELDRLVGKSYESEPHLLIVIIHYLMSGKAKRQPHLIDSLLKKYEGELPPKQLTLFQEAAALKVNEPALLNELFVNLLLQVHPSAGPTNKFEFLRYEFDSFLSNDSDLSYLQSTLSNHWPELSRRLQEQTVPDLRRLMQLLRKRRMSLAVVQQIESRLVEIESAVQACDELNDVILNVADRDGLREIVGPFDATIAGLQRVVCSDEADTVHAAFRGLIAEIRHIVRSTVNMIKTSNLLQKHGIVCNVKVPDESCYVFCQPPDLVQAVSNLIENLIHAFPTTSRQPKQAEIVVEAMSNSARFTIRDAGTAKFPIKQGIGLQEVNSIVSAYDGDFFPPKKILNGIFKTEVAFELKRISEDLIS